MATTATDPSEGAFDDPAFGAGRRSPWLSPVAAPFAESSRTSPSFNPGDRNDRKPNRRTRLASDRTDGVSSARSKLRRDLADKPRVRRRPGPSQGIDGHVPLATGDLLSGIVASLFAPFGRSDRLTVDDRRRGRRLLGGRRANPFHQRIVQLLPEPGQSPTAEDRVDRFPLRKVVRQGPPLAARSIQVGA